MIRLLTHHGGKIPPVYVRRIIKRLGWILDSILPELMIAFDGKPETHHVARFLYLEQQWRNLHLVFGLPERHQRAMRWIGQRLLDEPFVAKWHVDVVDACQNDQYSELTVLLAESSDQARNPGVSDPELERVRNSALQDSLGRLAAEIDLKSRLTA